jgi:hypothetical protein
MVECWKRRSVTTRRAIVCSVIAVATPLVAAAPAYADDQGFLNYLEPRWAFLSADQLLTEGHKACNFILAGNSASNAAAMVAADLDTNDRVVASEIVRTAVTQLGC